MPYKITIYCPDNHISYNLNTLDKIGVGGGITTRIRVAHALARRGHEVQLFINCPVEGCTLGVNYFHCSQIRKVESDIFIASTSGDKLDFSEKLHGSAEANRIGQGGRQRINGV